MLSEIKHCRMSQLKMVLKLVEVKIARQASLEKYFEKLQEFRIASDDEILRWYISRFDEVDDHAVIEMVYEPGGVGNTIMTIENDSN